MQLFVRGQQTHVLEVQPSETIEVIKVGWTKNCELEEDPAEKADLLLIRR